ncbi:MAG: N-acetylmuramic acid 6-phosphate etherase [Ignavibacteriales bacterium]|nr:N-acetylmuramic acid 6-phosphate etherase [Ignavibacteriales bacterium]
MSDQKILFEQLNKLTTEQRNPASMDIDARSITEILTIINNDDQKIAAIVGKEIPYIAQAVELIVAAFKKGGRLGVLDASECPPTFGVHPEMVQGIIAGGEAAMFKAQEGAEDKEENGAKAIDEKNISEKDVVFGIAASLRTPFVVGAVKRAKEQGAKTVYLTTNPRSKIYSDEFSAISKAVDVAICPEVGPEIIMGSTRMKSATAQKLVLTMVTTTSMIRLGKVYENMMIDLQMTNLKLKERAKRIVMTITGVDYETALNYLEKADGHVKTALVMIKANVSKEEAKHRLEKADGFVRAAIKGEKTQ